MKPLVLAAAIAALGTASVPATAAAPAPAAAAAAPTYADLATLADAAPLTLRARIRSQILVPPERAPGLAPGHVRLYVEAQTLALIAGTTAAPESIRYLVDVPLNAKGKVPKLKKQEVLLFARAVPGRPGEVQLVSPVAQLPWSPDTDSRLRPILAALAAPDVRPRVTGVRDVLSSSGNLAGESETQIFLATSDGSPAALTVIRRPGQPPHWGVSWTELIDQSAQPAPPETIAWFRLACSLPARLPDSSNLGPDPEDRARAAQDYRFVIDRLGPCARNLQ